LASSSPRGHALRLALVGGDTLLGRELEEVLKSRGTGVVTIPYAASGEGNFSDQEGEAVYLEPLEGKAVREDEAILVAGSRQGALKAYELAKAEGGRPLVIDCTGHLDHQVEARILAPLLGEHQIPASWLLVIAHPAASALALVLKRLQRYKPIVRTLAHIFEPASERGKHGASELHQQTASLLGFKPLEKRVFDAQLSFNLLSRYGEEAPDKLSAVEARIEHHIATILSREAGKSAIPMPSLRLIQAPVFHGYSISIWTEFETTVNAIELGEALASAQIEVRGPNEEAPHNVGVASQSGLMAGDIRIDRNNSRAAWFWIVGDNLRLTADAAVDVLMELGATKG